MFVEKRYGYDDMTKVCCHLTCYSASFFVSCVVFLNINKRHASQILRLPEASKGQGPQNSING